MTRPRRSLLFMPGSNARALEKARILPADGIILDLEDSVAPEAKGLAREQIARAIASGGFGKREVLIRTNALDTPWWSDDVKMAAVARPDAILVPKVSSLDDLSTIAGCLRDANADSSIRVWTMIETARAVLHAEELAAASRNVEPRLAGFVFGPNDISRETRIRMQPGRATMLPMIIHCILAARSCGLEILRRTLQRFQQCQRLQPGVHAGARPRLRRQDADPPGPDRGLQCHLYAACGRSRACPQNHRRVRACRKTPRAAPYRSTARWWNGCMPTWQGARSRSPKSIADLARP